MRTMLSAFVVMSLLVCGCGKQETPPEKTPDQINSQKVKDNIDKAFED